jgi:hypothetical protein
MAQAAWNISNSGETFTDEEFALVFSFAPTEANSEILAKALKRSASSIRMIWKLAVKPQKDIDSHPEWPSNSHVTRLRAAADTAGWVLKQ